MDYAWDFSVVLRDAPLLLAGLVNTLKVTGLALLFGVPLGLALAGLAWLDRWAEHRSGETPPGGTYRDTS